MGAALGFFAGAFAAPDTNEVKQKVKDKLAIPLRAYYRGVAADCMTNYGHYMSDVSAYLETEIRRYYSTYDAIVSQRIKDWNSQHRSVRENIARIENEIQGIKNRQQSINNIIKKLKN